MADVLVSTPRILDPIGGTVLNFRDISHLVYHFCDGGSSVSLTSAVSAGRVRSASGSTAVSVASSALSDRMIQPTSAVALAVSSAAAAERVVHLSATAMMAVSSTIPQIVSTLVINDATTSVDIATTAAVNLSLDATVSANSVVSCEAEVYLYRDGGYKTEVGNASTAVGGTVGGFTGTTTTGSIGFSTVPSSGGVIVIPQSTYNTDGV